MIVGWLPSAFITMSDDALPKKVLIKAILLPSGDHAGQLISKSTNAVLKVSCRRLLPSAFITHMFQPSRYFAKAILLPSGEYARHEFVPVLRFVCPVPSGLIVKMSQVASENLMKATFPFAAVTAIEVRAGIIRHTKTKIHRVGQSRERRCRYLQVRKGRAL